MTDTPPYGDRVAADHVITRLGFPASESVKLLLAAMRADWLTPREAGQLAPLARAIAYLAELPLPTHRGSDV